MQLSIAYALLALAIISEVTGLTFLAKSDGFSKLIPICITLTCFAIAFICCLMSSGPFPLA